ncbi:PepSY domain-containing protein [Fictibacillus iocasae]|uniref:PepSY domain-containing protein n=1 Tax=Fictibacillus iocasae TaxID=2715437 RepID=A0ABW2NUE5_9BACL
MKKSWMAVSAALVITGAGITAASSYSPLNFIKVDTLHGNKEDIEKDLQKEWEQKVQVTKEEAQKIACKMVSGQVVQTELDQTESSIVYDVVIYDGQTFKEVTLKASDGKIVNVAEDEEAEKKAEWLKP